MDLDKLRALVELSRLRTMTAVAEATGFGTSTVSQQLSALERQCGVPLLEAEGRRVRLTAAGRRLAERGRDILAAVTAAEMDLSTRSEPHGLVRVAGYTTAMRRHLLPAMAQLARSDPEVRLEIRESEPDEVIALLDTDVIDIGFVYDYTMVPRRWTHPHQHLSTSTMVLAVPQDISLPDRITTPADLAPLRNVGWIGNSRDTGDDELSARLCALAGWLPRMTHRADSLDLVVDLVLAGHGVSVLPTDSFEAQRVRTVALDLADTGRRMWSLVRSGAEQWPANRAVVENVCRQIAASTSAQPAPNATAGSSSR
ncbi:DNA-binding transcriptional LysR family regulator [Nakamurella sp. UYEF19]|uniref:LysR family transcriptional regulator n=1 Tax=Nakamurella sp. UYEF19 TaxID=1756392 RepID=UPI003395B970